MPLTIADDLLKEAGMDEDAARIEIACWLFESRKLTLHFASKWANLSRVELEAELLKRRIPLYSPTHKDLLEDLSALDKLGI